MNGTIILAGQLYNVLSCYGAEKDLNGKFIVRGNIISFMGAGEEFVIDDTAEYLREGQWHNLLAAVKSTSYYIPMVVL
jgi:hypothetical protein